VQQIGREFAKAGDLLRGTSPVAEVAFLHSYDDRWSVELQKHSKDFDDRQLFTSYYRPLRALVDTIDVVSPMAPLTNYKLVVAPALNLVSDAEARHLLEFVNNGGHLVLGIRSGMKDEYNALLPALQPGPFREALGAEIAQYYALDKPVPLEYEHGPGEVKIWAERLKVSAPDAQVLATYGKSNGWLDGQPAVVTRRVGKGRITYMGAWADDRSMDVFAHWLAQISNLDQRFPAPEGVEVSRRVAGDREVYVVVNATDTSKRVPLPSPMVEHLRGHGSPVRELELPAYEVAVLTK
jgi:beta-galactosidase